MPFIVTASNRAPVRGDVPVPASRPYTLGEEVAVEPEPATAPQTRPAQTAARLSPAITRQPEPVRNATLLPRSLTEQAQSISTGNAPVESGFRSSAQSLPAATSAFAPLPGSNGSGIRGLY